MLNNVTRQGIQDILSSFDDNNLFSLAATVTQGLLRNKVEGREEAVNAILNYSSDALSILKRKIVTREALFAYLHKNNVSLELPATKNDIIDKITEFWNSSASQITTATNNYNTNTADAGSVSLFAEQFAGWFYDMLNKKECVSPEHFYSDAKLTINMINNGQTVTESVENNPQELVKKLFATKMLFNLFFNPNLSRDGVRGQVDVHGLVVVLVCGTLHSNGVCVGVFEQMFGLARDPHAENNWKIKNSEVNLKSQEGVATLPTLPVLSLT